MRAQVAAQSLAQQCGVVINVILGNTLEAVFAQRGRHRVGIGSADLVRRNRLARLDQFAAS